MEDVKDLLLDFTHYLIYWDKYLTLSVRIRTLAKEGNFELMGCEIDNRGRLLKILFPLKQKIDKKAMIINPDVFEGLYQKLRSAISDVANLIQIIDGESIDLLSLEKVTAAKNLVNISKLRPYLFP